MDTNDTQYNRTSTLLTATLTFFVMGAWFYYYSQQRLIAGDEGYYTLAARLVSQGKVPYRDFFYPQMPLMPYIYGAVFKAFDHTWAVARGFSAALTTLVGVLLYFAIQTDRKLIYRRSLAVYASALFAICNFVFPWYVCSLTYALSVLLLLGAVLLLDRGDAALPTPYRTFFAGILLGLAVCTRLFFAGLGPFMVLWLFIRRGALVEKIKASAILTVSTFIGLLPCLPLALLCPQSFYFGNLGYHLGRSTLSDVEETRNKWRVAKVVFGLVDSVKFSAFHFPLLLWLSLLLPLLGVVICVIRSRGKAKQTDSSTVALGVGSSQWISLSWFLVVGLLFLNLIPTPTYVQYYSSLVPFCILAIVRSSSYFLEMFPRQRDKRLAAISVGLLALCLYLPGTYEDIGRYSRTGIGVIGIETQAKAKEWTLARVATITEAINRHSSADNAVLAAWPGYLLEAKASAFPGSENHFGMRIAPSLSKSEREEHLLIDFDAAYSRLGTETQPDLFVLSKYGKVRVTDTTGKKELLSSKLLEHNYSIVAEVPPIVVYSSNPTTGD